jgi:rhamnulokinase
MNADYLAFDLGAESGRAILGRLRSGFLHLEEIHRFPNQPIRKEGSLRWNIRALWSEMRRGLDRVTDARPTSIGVDT